MRMTPIYTRFGKIYIDDGNLASNYDGRVSVYDSDYKYLTYYQSENACPTREEIDEYINSLEDAEDLKDIVFDLECTSENWVDIAVKMGIDYYIDEHRMFDEVVNNEYVNRIGNHFILINE